MYIYIYIGCSNIAGLMYIRCVNPIGCNNLHDLEHDFLHEGEHQKARFCARRKTLKTTFFLGATFGGYLCKKCFFYLLQVLGSTQYIRVCLYISLCKSIYIYMYKYMYIHMYTVLRSFIQPNNALFNPVQFSCATLLTCSLP